MSKQLFAIDEVILPKNLPEGVAGAPTRTGLIQSRFVRPMARIVLRHGTYRKISIIPTEIRSGLAQSCFRILILSCLRDSSILKHLGL